MAMARVAVVTPRVHLGDPLRNAESAVELARRADGDGAVVTVFPELSLTGYSIDDLFHQRRMLDAVERSVELVARATTDLATVMVLGAPLLVDGALLNCALVVSGGAPVAAVPKSYLPNYREFYEARHFASGRGSVALTARVVGHDIPFGTDLILDVPAVEGLIVHVEICEDLWTAVPPSSLGALAGANLLLNLSASNATLGKAEDRRLLSRSQSLRCVAASVLSASGSGESTTDLAWDGQAIVHELGLPIAEGPRFAADSQILLADIDIERINQERMRMTTFSDARAEHASSWRRVVIGPRTAPTRTAPLRRPNPRHPYVPDSPADLDDRCYEAYSIQCQGLVQRLRATGIERVVLGVSGGLDSTHALLVAVRVMQDLELPAANVLAYSLPGMASSAETQGNALRLARALGVTHSVIGITEQSVQMLRDIGHPARKGGGPYDATYENVQAGARTSVLFRLANLNDALVIGTGDLSELALGWCTYGVGDQMSHYNVNASVPKTLLRHLIRWVADREVHGADVSDALRGILETPISPELLPPDSPGGIQRTEDVVGPYDLHDFFLFHTLRFGLRPETVRAYAIDAWGPESVAASGVSEEGGSSDAYSVDAIDRWLDEFLQRFFGRSQFKRTASPSGPKVTTGGSLSPRGDWRAPADGNARIWGQNWA